MRLVEYQDNNSQNIEMKNQSSFIINNFNQNQVPYDTVYPEPQKINTNELNYLQNQEFLESQNQLNNKYNQQYQQQYTQFDSDSMFSQNIIVQNLPFAESQEEVYDNQYNAQNFLQNQVIYQQNEEQNTLINNNQIIYYEIEQCQNNQNYETNLIYETNQNYEDNQQNYGVNQNYEEPYIISQQNLVDPYSILIANNNINNYNYQNQNISQPQSVKQEIEQNPRYVDFQYVNIRQDQQQQKYQSNNGQNITIYELPEKQTTNNNFKQSNNEQKQIPQTNIIQANNVKKNIGDSIQLKINYQYIENKKQNFELTSHQNKIDENTNTSDSEYNENDYEGIDNNQQIYSANQNTNSSFDDDFNDSNSSQSSRNKESGLLKDVQKSKKTIKKYLPKKKYQQSRQKNIFKNFGNALINCIQNNYVIREYITKRFENDSNLVKAFYDSFLKDFLHHLKNKEDFLLGWKTQNDADDSQMILFKQVFKDVSLCFFNDYAAKYVNESEKLKNKDIHIKAIPLFIRGIRNVNELFKFRLQ